MTRLLALILGLALTFAATAPAGAPKAVRVTRIDISSAHRVLVGVDAASGATTVTLAYIRSPRTVRVGSRCVAKPTDHRIAIEAHTLRLDTTARLDTPASAQGGAFVSRASTSKLVVRQTLNGRVLREGLGRLTGQPKGEIGRSLRTLQRSARTRHKGIWRRCAR
jgi:endonuclease YncB( thermonuclease family)